MKDTSGGCLQLASCNLDLNTCTCVTADLTGVLRGFSDGVIDIRRNEKNKGFSPARGSRGVGLAIFFLRVYAMPHDPKSLGMSG